MTEYRIAIPAKLHYALGDRGTFHGDSDLTRAALKMSESAMREKHGRGYRYVLASADKGVLDFVIGCLRELLALVEEGTLSATGLGVRRDELLRVVQQKIRVIPPEQLAAERYAARMYGGPDHGRA